MNCRACSGDSCYHALGCPREAANTEVRRLKRKCNQLLRKMLREREEAVLESEACKRAEALVLRHRKIIDNLGILLREEQGHYAIALDLANKAGQERDTALAELRQLRDPNGLRELLFGDPEPTRSA